MKRFVSIFGIVILTMSLFATSAFAAGIGATRETDPNNTKETANGRTWAYPFNDTYHVYGSLDPNDDQEDWLNLTLDATGYSYLFSTVAFYGNSNCTYEINIFDKNMSPRGKLISTDGTVVSMSDILFRQREDNYYQVKLISGNPLSPYFIRITADNAYKSISEIKDKAQLEKIMEIEELNKASDENKDNIDKDSTNVVLEPSSADISEANNANEVIEE